MKHICMAFNLAVFFCLLFHSIEAVRPSVGVVRRVTGRVKRILRINDRSDIKQHKLIPGPNAGNVSPVNNNHNEYKEVMKIVGELDGKVDGGSRKNSPLEETKKQQLIGKLLEYWRMRK